MLIDIIYIYIYISSIVIRTILETGSVDAGMMDGLFSKWTMDSFESCGKRNGMVYGIQDVHHVASFDHDAERGFKNARHGPIILPSLSFKQIHAIINQSLYNHHPFFLLLSHSYASIHHH